jgi:hypothetical protein
LQRPDSSRVRKSRPFVDKRIEEFTELSPRPGHDALRIAAISERTSNGGASMILRAHRMVRLRRSALVVAALSFWAPLASAEEAGAPDIQKRETASEPAPVNFMAVTAPARLADASLTATTWAGYDGAIANPRVSTSVEAVLIHRLAIAVGAESSADGKGEFTLRPLVALRVQVLEQEAIGVDATAAVTYRQDRFALDGGFFQATIALGRRFDRLSLALNLTYGIDPEGDDHEGEVCAAARFEVSPSFYLGVDGRYRHDLGSTDPNRADRARSESETLAGATGGYVHGRWAIMLEAGISRVVATSVRTGPVALAGYTAAF